MKIMTIDDHCNYMELGLEKRKHSTFFRWLCFKYTSIVNDYRTFLKFSPNDIASYIDLVKDIGYFISLALNTNIDTVYKEEERDYLLSKAYRLFNRVKSYGKEHFKKQ